MEDPNLNVGNIGKGQHRNLILKSFLFCFVLFFSQNAVSEFSLTVREGG